MKKLLNSLLVLTTLATPTLTVVACNNQLEPANQGYDYDIAVAINKINYTLNVGLLDTEANIIKQITPQFIKMSLNKNLQNNFIDNKLKITEITYNGNSLKPQDLSQLGQIKTLLTLDYGAIKVETKLNLTIYDQYQNQVAKAIANADYQYTNDTESTLKDLQTTITTNFINTQLDLETQKEFHADKLIIKEFLKNNKPLVPSDFKVTGTFFITINFQYYDIKSNLILKMFLNPTINNQITNAINNSIYSKSVIAGTKVESLKNDINIEFIKDKLSQEYKKQFLDQNWHFINLLNKNKTNLSDNDLLNPNNLDAIIQFSYDGIQGQTALELNITENADTRIVEAIESINLKYFYLTVAYRDADSYFTADFIKQQLSLNMQKEFQTEKYKFIKMEWWSMDDGRLYYNYKLHFSYNGQSGIVPIVQATDMFSRFLTDKNEAKLEIKNNSTIQDLTNLFWNNWKNFVLGNTDPKYKDDYQFVINLFHLQLLGFVDLNQNQLTDKDLITKGTISIFVCMFIQNVPTMMPFQITII
ncbi:Vmc-like lipoprotein signal peptide domain-containing protein [Spiroplasma sp. AdecLV25b]|uniref:Vmc-like lipoprotein signal peptide domain-containing protein n=1 Tax=Spiroplasma sp. AdecLV25b TaxID=3027162 RepID=UPI0027E178CA|nr:hypothetical protein [Spiroplasma sp. AdecLV25b]